MRWFIRFLSVYYAWFIRGAHMIYKGFFWHWISKGDLRRTYKEFIGSLKGVYTRPTDLLVIYQWFTCVLQGSRYYQWFFIGILRVIYTEFVRDLSRISTWIKWNLASIVFHGQTQLGCRKEISPQFPLFVLFYKHQLVSWSLTQLSIYFNETNFICN